MSRTVSCVDMRRVDWKSKDWNCRTIHDEDGTPVQTEYLFNIHGEMRWFPATAIPTDLIMDTMVKTFIADTNLGIWETGSCKQTCRDLFADAVVKHIDHLDTVFELAGKSWMFEFENTVTARILDRWPRAKAVCFEKDACVAKMIAAPHHQPVVYRDTNLQVVEGAMEGKAHREMFRGARAVWQDLCGPISYYVLDFFTDLVVNLMPVNSILAITINAHSRQDKNNKIDSTHRRHIKRDSPVPAQDFIQELRDSAEERGLFLVVISYVRYGHKTQSDMNFIVMHLTDKDRDDAPVENIVRHSSLRCGGEIGRNQVQDEDQEEQEQEDEDEVEDKVETGQGRTESFSVSPMPPGQSRDVTTDIVGNDPVLKVAIAKEKVDDDDDKDDQEEEEEVELERKWEEEVAAAKEVDDDDDEEEEEEEKEEQDDGVVIVEASFMPVRPPTRSLAGKKRSNQEMAVQEKNDDGGDEDDEDEEDDPKDLQSRGTEKSSGEPACKVAKKMEGQVATDLSLLLSSLPPSVFCSADKDVFEIDDIQNKTVFMSYWPTDVCVWRIIQDAKEVIIDSVAVVKHERFLGRKWRTMQFLYCTFEGNSFYPHSDFKASRLEFIDCEGLEVIHVPSRSADSLYVRDCLDLTTIKTTSPESTIIKNCPLAQIDSQLNNTRPCAKSRRVERSSSLSPPPPPPPPPEIAPETRNARALCRHYLNKDPADVSKEHRFEIAAVKKYELSLSESHVVCYKLPESSTGWNTLAKAKSVMFHGIHIVSPRHHFSSLIRNWKTVIFQECRFANQTFSAPDFMVHSLVFRKCSNLRSTKPLEYVGAIRVENCPEFQSLGEMASLAYPPMIKNCPKYEAREEEEDEDEEDY
jgi:hypothetical protein